MSDNLTPKQKLFCEEFLVDLNATKAAIRAGYSENTAQQISSSLLLKVVIQDHIAELKLKRSEKVSITAEEVLKELKAFAYSDITDTIMLTTDQIKELPPEVRRLIISYKKVKRRFGEDGEWEEESVELKFVDKIRVFDMLNKHIGFYAPIEVNITSIDPDIDFTKP